MKKYNPWFDVGRSKLLNQRKQTKLQWLQDPREINGDNLNISQKAFVGFDVTVQLLIRVSAFVRY
jgi:hypothetical protein